eukprot:1229436-Rhodomonas_salina.2
MSRGTLTCEVCVLCGQAGGPLGGLYMDDATTSEHSSPSARALSAFDLAHVSLGTVLGCCVVR